MNAPLDPALRLALATLPPGVDDEEALCQHLLPQLRTVVSTPDESSAALCSSAYALLAQLPAQPVTAARIECLLAIAHYYHLAAQPIATLDPGRLAVDLARARGDAPLLRKALNFLGVFQAEGGNFPEATASYSEALTLAQQLGDAYAEASVWNNLGLALMYAAQYDEAIRCFHRVAALSQTVAMPAVQRAALCNLASCAVHRRDPRAGLAAVRQAIALNPAPANALDCLSRTIAESNYVRLLLEVGDTELARQRAALAREIAARMPAARTEFVAGMCSGLVDIHAGAIEAGLNQLKRSLEQARTSVRSEVRDALHTCIAGYEAAGQPDVALVYLHELLALNKAATEARVLMHHQQHVARLERSAPAVEPADSDLVRQQDQLRSQLGERDLTRNRILLLEQQSVAAELHDDTTGEHCYRVGRLASLLGKEIGLEEDVCFLIDLAARLHDIGKLVVPDAILLKPGRLTPGERAIMETHTTAGADILARSNVPQMHIAEEIARHHHERWDGTGYPLRLARSAIPIAARVTALADVFDALTHVRPYKEAWPVAEALAEIRRLRGQQFDPELTDVFLQLVPRLQREVGDLDAFLAEDAQNSPFIQARRQIAAALKGSDPATSLFDLRR